MSTLSAGHPPRALAGCPPVSVCACCHGNTLTLCPPLLRCRRNSRPCLNPGQNLPLPPGHRTRTIPYARRKLSPALHSVDRGPAQASQPHHCRQPDKTIVVTSSHQRPPRKSVSSLPQHTDRGWRCRRKNVHSPGVCLIVTYPPSRAPMRVTSYGGMTNCVVLQESALALILLYETGR